MPLQPPSHCWNELNFDVAIFNQSSKVLILVGCKSSVSDAEKEVGEVAQAVKTANAHKPQQGNCGRQNRRYGMCDLCECGIFSEN